MALSIREIVGGKTEQETRFTISSLTADAERQGDAIRGQEWKRLRFRQAEILGR